MFLVILAQINVFSRPKMLQKASEMLIGSFLIINILIKKMLLDADLTFNNGKPLQDNQYKNLRVIAACFYHAYNDKYKGINWNLNSTQTIEYVEPPVPKTTPILFGNQKSSKNAKMEKFGKLQKID